MTIHRRVGRKMTHVTRASTYTQVAVGQNQWYQFGVGAPPILVDFSWDWDVHWGYDLDFDPWPSGGHLATTIIPVGGLGRFCTAQVAMKVQREAEGMGIMGTGVTRRGPMAYLQGANWKTHPA